MKALFTLYIIFQFNIGFGQNYLNDTISAGDYFTLFQASYDVDSGYYCVGSALFTEHVPYQQYFFGFIDYSGNWQDVLVDYDTLNDQRAGFGNGKLILNNRGNFVHFYNNCDSSNCYPRIKEVSSSGQVIYDVKFDVLFDSLNHMNSDFNNIYYNDSLNRYYLLSSVSRVNPTNPPILYIETDSVFNVIDTLIIDDPMDEWTFSEPHMVFNGDDKLFMITARDYPGGEENQLAKIVFFKLDENNNLTGNTGHAEHVKPV
jgi:hypothetical protein